MEEEGSFVLIECQHCMSQWVEPWHEAIVCPTCEAGRLQDAEEIDYFFSPDGLTLMIWEETVT